MYVLKIYPHQLHDSSISHALLLNSLNNRGPHTTSSSRPPSRPTPTTTHSATAARQAADDDVKEGQDAVDDDKEDGRNGIHDTHDHGADGLENGFDLRLVSDVIWKSRGAVRRRRRHPFS
jgi:hypothetical protein